MTTKTKAPDTSVRVELTRAEPSSTALAPSMAIVRVASGEERLAATEHLKGVRLLKKRVEEHYQRIKRPLLDAIQNVRDMEAEDLRPILQADAHLTGIVTAYDRQERERAEAENRRRQAVAEEEAKRRREEEAEAIRRTAKEATDRATKLALNRQAKAVAAAPPVVRDVEVERPDLSGAQGVGSRTTHKARVSDPAKAILAAAASEMLRLVLMSNGNVGAARDVLVPFIGTGTPLPFSCLRLHEPALNDLAKQLGTSFHAPGVDGVAVDGLSVRG